VRVLVCGDRNWTEQVPIYMRLRQLPRDTVVIHGCARGADTIGGQVARSLGFKVLEFPADWDKYGKGAGPIRNQQMLDEGKPELVLAFHRNFADSKGTKDMVSRAKKANIPCEVIG
jgi:hypothetical protein